MSRKRLPAVRVLTPAERRGLFEQTSQAELGISGEQFVRRWKQGKYVKRACEPKILRVAMLLPLAH